MDKSDIGFIGLGVMGQSLVINMASHGYTVSVYNRTPERTAEFMEGKARNITGITAAYSIDELAGSLKSPKKIMIMVKAGEPVDMVIDSLVPYLNRGDIIIDGGNSYFKDTIRRYDSLQKLDIKYLGVGISGGEEGALKGPSIMPGGSSDAWDEVKNIFIDISAKTSDGEACCDYIGRGGAGHFVKMVHNGIEYADMQLITETYGIMREIGGMSVDEIQKVFEGWNSRELSSYLIEITSDILKRVDDETGKPLVDVILDASKEKGTGKWVSEEALNIKTPIPTITESLFARYISSQKVERVKASRILAGPEKPVPVDKKQMIEDLENALYASKICSYAQGFDILKQASHVYGWELNLGRIAMLWRGGCIIRAGFLDKIKAAYDNNSKLDNLLLDPCFKNAIDNAQDGWRRIVSIASLNGIPVPGIGSALSYYDSYRSEKLPANLIQAQRDYFGSHTYERVDREGVFHTQWTD